MVLTKGSTSITYIRMAEGFVYLVAIMDWFSRFVLSWSLSLTLEIGFCIEALKNGAIDAVTTDEVILAGYAAQSPGAFKIVGQPFSEENYGIGLKKDDTDLQTKITAAITKMESDGSWKAAFEKNLGPAGIATPAPPVLDK